MHATFPPITLFRIKPMKPETPNHVLNFVSDFSDNTNSDLIVIRLAQTRAPVIETVIQMTRVVITQLQVNKGFRGRTRDGRNMTVNYPPQGVCVFVDNRPIIDSPISISIRG